MKFTKLLKVFAKSAITLTFAAFAFSCANNVSNASVSDSNTKTRTLNIEVSNYGELVEAVNNISANKVATTTASRTIIADSFDLDGIALYLYGTSIAGTTYGPTKVTATPDATNKKIGTVAIPAETQNWDFTLYAVDSSDPTEYTDKDTLFSAAVLIGHSSMDMTNGDTAKFTLSPDGLTKNSDISLSLTLDGWDLPSDYTSTVGFYLLTTGADATTSGDGLGPTTTIDTTLSLEKTTAKTYTVSSMTPGTYLFKVTFANSTTGTTFYWSDVIIILPGKNLSTSIAIPNVIGTKPNDVTNFSAGYEKDDAYPGLFIVDFNWTRPTTKNEDYYEIDIIELSSTEETVTAPTNDTWATVGTSTTYAGVSDTYAKKIGTTITAFASSDVYEGGSLLGGNNSAQFRLELGKRYFARIRAGNYVGTSENYTLVDLSKTPASGNKFTSETINRYRITYNVNGGNYYKDSSEISDTTSLIAKSDNIVEYFCQNTTGNTVIQGDGKTVYNDSNYYLYKYGTYNWSYWSYYDNGVAKKYAKDSNKGYENLDLYAVYQGNASVEVDDKSMYDILATWISYKLDPLGTDTTLTTGQKTVTFDITNETSATWIFKPVATTEGKITNTFTFDKVNFTVSKGGVTYTSQEASDVDTITGKSFTQDFSKMSSGVYNVLFTAHTGTTVVSYPITLTIQK